MDKRPDLSNCKKCGDILPLMCVDFLILEMAARRESHIPVFGGAYAKLAAAFMTPLSVVLSQAGFFSLFHFSLPFELNDRKLEFNISLWSDRFQKPFWPQINSGSLKNSLKITFCKLEQLKIISQY